MNFLTSFPGKQELLEWWRNQAEGQVYKVNCHIHTPYSFSAFANIAQAFEMALNEDIRVLGINDFFVADGYDEFLKHALTNRVFPEFSIEFIGLLKQEQELGIKINDPNNPGRIYFSGKGLNFPFSLSAQNQQKLEQVKSESQKQARKMLERTNELLEQAQSPFTFDFVSLKKEFAKDLLRERHIAKAIRVRMNEFYKTEAEKKSFLTQLYAGKDQKASISDNIQLEEEIRGNLLKAGGAAFVPEDEKAFLPLEEIINIITDAGGIPCYPVLLDDKNGNYTPFEADDRKLADRLTELGVGCIELIPGRNRFENLTRFVKNMVERGFVINFGTEHNSPQLSPLTVKTTDRELDGYLKKVAYNGACVVAAHQYLKAKDQEGFLNSHRMTKQSEIAHFIELGQAVIENYLKSND
ncbi:MAG: PHP domain-containing protein [Bacteroidales bacterium]